MSSYHDKFVKVKGYPLLINRKGVVKNIKNNRIKKPSINTDGYIQISFNKTTTKLHRLLGIAFIPNPLNKKQINHKDGNKQNNSLNNLEWATSSENVLHCYRILKKGFKIHRGKHMKNRFKGVGKCFNRYFARIVVNNKHIYLGSFTTKKEAAKAYNKAALIYHTHPVLNEV